MSYSWDWMRSEHSFSLEFKTNVRAMLYHLITSAFFRGRQSPLTSFYFHYLEILPYLWLCPSFGRDSSPSCSLFCCYDHLLMKHSSTALLISQQNKFSHKSLVILWLLVSLQSSVDVSVKLGLGRKKYLENF